MINKEIFSWNRFVAVCKKDMMENWKTMLLRLVMLYATLAIVFCFICYWDCDCILNGHSKEIINKVDDYYVVAGLLFCFFGFFLASFTFEGMRSKTKRISFLMTPSTMFEKFFSRFLLVVPIYLFVFLLAFHLADYTRVLLFSIFYSNIDINTIGLVRLMDSNGDYFSNWGNVFSALSKMFSGLSKIFFIQSIFALGSVIWYNKVAIKVVASLVALSALFFVINGTLIHLLFDSGMNGFFQSLNSDVWFANICIKSTFFSWFFMFLGIMNWIIIYYRLKESEIINRL